MTITMYSKLSCPNCDKARTFLAQKGIKFIEIKISEHPLDDLTPWIKLDTFKEKYPTVRSVPLILSDDKLIGGYQELLKYKLEIA